MKKETEVFFHEFIQLFDVFLSDWLPSQKFSMDNCRIVVFLSNDATNKGKNLIFLLRYFIAVQQICFGSKSEQPNYKGTVMPLRQLKPNFISSSILGALYRVVQVLKPCCC